jgi:hypothetical protein
LGEHPGYLEAKRFLRELGLKTDLSNADDMVPLFRAKWLGTDQNFKVGFVQLAKVSSRKWSLTKKLDALQAVDMKKDQPAQSEDSRAYEVKEDGQQASSNET